MIDRGTFKLARIGHISATMLGKMLQRTPQAPGDQKVPYLRAGLLDGLSDVRELPFMYAASAEVQAYGVKEGDLLVAEGGDVGRSEFALRLPERTIFQNSLHRVRLRGDGDIRFVRYVLMSIYSSGFLEVLCNKATFGHLTVEKLRQLQIPWPQPCMQRAIADYLDIEAGRIDALISRKRQMIELLNERWVSEVVKAMRVSRCISTDMTRVPLRRVIDSTIGGAWGKPAGEDYLDAFCIRGTDFNTSDLEANRENAPKRSFTHEEFRRRRLLAGDLLIEKSGGGDKQPVGRVVQWVGDDAGVPTNFAARLRPASGVDSRYLTFLFRAAYETGQTRAWIKQTTGIQNLDLGGFLSEKYPIPPLQDQSAIAGRLDGVTCRRNRVQERLKAQIALLSERRQALITAAVTGELSIPGIAA